MHFKLESAHKQTLMHPTGIVLWLRDREGLFPLLQLEGDNDATTAGWLTFASTKRVEVLLVQASVAEWNEGETGVSRVLERVSKELGRADIRAVKLIRVERDRHTHGRSFQVFRATQREPELVYSSLAGDGEAKVDRRQSLAAFHEAGGSVLVHPLVSGSLESSTTGAA